MQVGCKLTVDVANKLYVRRKTFVMLANPHYKMLLQFSLNSICGAGDLFAAMRREANELPCLRYTSLCLNWGLQEF